MKKVMKSKVSQLKINKASVADSIEIQMERLLNNEGLDGVENKELKYTRADEGVIGITDIRFDKWDAAIEQNEKIMESERERLEDKRKKREEILEKNKEKAKGNGDSDVINQTHTTTSEGTE